MLAWNMVELRGIKKVTAPEQRAAGAQSIDHIGPGELSIMGSSGSGKNPC